VVLQASIVDNYATHKHPNVKEWLTKHPHFHMHFTPTSASWVNLVERLFRDITEDQIRRGIFRSVDELKTNNHGISGSPQCQSQTLSLDRCT
jgi:hypothetical protein